MLKTINLFLPTASPVDPRPASYAIQFAGLTFRLPDEFLQAPKTQLCFYAACDHTGLFLYTKHPMWAHDSESFFSLGGNVFEIAPEATVPQTCLDTFFGSNAHPSTYISSYQFHFNYPFHSEDIEAMIDAIAPQNTQAEAGHGS